MALDVTSQVSTSFKRGTTIVASDISSYAASSAEMVILDYAIADQVSDQSVGLGPIAAADFMLLISDRQVSVKINGALAAVACKQLVLTGSNVSSLSISNASGGTANLRIFMTGA